MFFEYFIIFKYIFFLLFLMLLLALGSFFLVYHNFDEEKYTSYECGFNPFGDARVKFEVRFYLVGILFIIFDLEVAFLFPWAIIALHLSTVGVFIMVIFIFILSIGFVYEWLKGALDWI